MSMIFAPADADSLPLFILEPDGLQGWLADQPDHVGRWLNSMGFEASLGQTCLVPDADGAAQLAVFGFGDAKSRARGRFHLAMAAKALPEGVYHIQTPLAPDDLQEAALGWLLAGYQFDRYRSQKPVLAQLKAPEGIDADRLQVIAAGEELSRDLINIPASDMGPQQLEEAFLELAKTHGARTNVISGDELLAQNLPIIHAVGRASDQAPRLLDMRWGDSGPTLTLVGKGVCFDTGGLNIKPGISMGLMKKDMGGAATAMGLAHMIMSLGLKLQLRVLVPAVENSISAGAMRPQDILTSRKGLTVEVNNTDAEGRLVLADALALADEESPDMLISIATLTGAARVAVGPDVVPFYCDDPEAARQVFAAGTLVRDPVWQLPFWTPYESMLEPGIADLDNSPKGGFAGSIMAALFLRRFVEQAGNYLHFDMYGWQPTAAPARPKGGVGQASRAILEALPKMLDL
ncbi:MAG: leucyl aminopeptidase [Rhodobacterales bacterium]|nr:MAG: leucyl aminopeptidase [Rhodobacterales bacterium]